MKTALFWFPFVFFLSVYVSGQTPAVGHTAGELAVSATGAATYSVPLTLPPGIGEVVPCNLYGHFKKKSAKNGKYMKANKL
ncbi:MAG: hypothetical protein ACON47_08845 [Flavobacteriaceae bacterium]